MENISKKATVAFGVVISAICVLFAVTVFISDNNSHNAKAAGWYNSDWQYRKIITIDSAKVTANLNNFPVLISEIDNDLRIVASGGHVENANGYDIVFVSSDGLTKFDHEVEKYNSVTGELIAWVKIPALFASIDTEIYMYYGNSAIVASQENINGVWDEGGNNNFKMVQHLQEDPSSSAPQMIDSSQYNNDGTSAGAMTSGDQVAGQIDGSIDFDGSDDYINLGNMDVSGSEITISAWINSNNLENCSLTYSDCRIISKANSTAENDHWWMLSTIESPSSSNNVYLRFRLKTNGTTITHIANSSILNTGTWVYVVARYDGSNVIIYRDGLPVYSGAQIGAIDTNVGVFANIGRNPVGGKEWDGFIDEVRISDTARSADWIKTEYNNQSSPATFYSVGAEEAGVPLIPSNVFGWAWSENIGWISFNSENCDMDDNTFLDIICGGDNTTDLVISYGVTLDASDNLSGYAWSENIGWISFESADIFGCPSGTCQPLLVGTNFQGWARALNYGDGWDGWISLSCKNNPGTCGTSNYEVSLSGNDFEGWAWGGDVVGWISFNCANEGSCGSSDYKVYLSGSNTPPTVKDLDYIPINYCRDDLGNIAFMWNFEDTEDLDVQTAYQIDLERDGGGVGNTCSTGKIFSSNILVKASVVNSKGTCSPDFISYGHNGYTWSVTVWDSGDLSDVKNSPPGNIINNIPAHQKPRALFDFIPTQPPATILQFQPVEFDPALSQVFGLSTIVNWTWDFGDGSPQVSLDNPLDSIDGKTIYSYLEANTYTVDLMVTDSDGYNCWASDRSNQRNIVIGGNKPTWNEVNP